MHLPDARLLVEGQAGTTIPTEASSAAAAAAGAAAGALVESQGGKHSSHHKKRFGWMRQAAMLTGGSTP